MFFVSLTRKGVYDYFIFVPGQPPARLYTYIHKLGIRDKEVSQCEKNHLGISLKIYVKVLNFILKKLQ